MTRRRTTVITDDDYFPQRAPRRRTSRLLLAAGAIVIALLALRVMEFRPGPVRAIPQSEPVAAIPAPSPEIAAPHEPQMKSHTFSLMPGQAFNVPNRIFRKVEIRSEYPLRVMTGRCHSDYTVEFFCEGDPADIFIADTRRMPVFTTPKGNSVTITITEF